MEFVLHKDWMFEMDRFSYVYREGVADFLRYAKHNTSDEIFPCPCIKCNNGSNQSSELIELHLIQWGIRKDYTLWDFHGETNESPYVPKRLENEESVHTHEGLEPPPLLNALINDAFGIHGLPPNEYEDSGCPPMQDDFLNNDKEYIRLKGDAMRPLYPDCKANQTTLYAIVGLHNLKSHFGLSGKAITGILQWVKDLLPKKNTLPDNYPHLKNCLKGLGMKYKSIHACKYDCILYRNEHKSKLKCPVCEEPRFVIDRDLRGSLKLGDTKAKPFASIPQKVLKYFPTAPRLKRLYTIPWIAEAMTWHSRAECGENLMRHPIDSIVWKNANLDHPDFASESRNVRLGLSTDGFNPHGNLATNKSVWPVILVPYNLPPSLCMKKEFSMLSLLIPGPKAPSDDIDVFLAPLVEELNDLWVNGTIAFDSFKQEEFTPTGDFRLSNEERKVFLDTLFELKVPSNFSSNLRRVVNYPTQDLRRLKSHDWHVIMQLAPLLFKHCFSKHVDLRRAIMQISLCFTLICEKVVNREHIMAAKLTLVEATCILEKVNEESNSSRCSPNADETIIKEHLVFSELGEVISSNKDQFMGRALDLLKVHVSLIYDTWSDVPSTKKNTIWNALLKEYEIPLIRRKKVMRKMSMQVCTWKKNLRMKYFKGLTTSEIRKLRDSPPEDEGIPKSVWMKFIDRESSEDKMKQRAQNKANRQKKKDVHCSGRLSNAQIAEKLRKQGKPYTRTHVFIEMRKQKKKNGEVHPGVADTVDKVKEVQKSQDERNFIPSSLNEDPLGQVCGPESRGRVRGKGSITSKTELEHLNFQSQVDNFATQNSEIQELKETVASLNGVVSNLSNIVTSLMKDKSSNTLGSASTAASDTATPSTTATTPPLCPASQCGMTCDSFMPLSSPTGYNTHQSIKLERYHLYGFSHSLPIALGEANPEPTPGTLVHTRPLAEHERRVNILKVMDGMENEPLYMGSQAGTSIIGEVIGAFIVWPFAFMKLAKN